ncbi:hypothetical protein GQ600_8348 [Phytophthora cactorum]|nr:hypothetical protein GQ600_8348 [Phytophthora cactorum]
MLVASPKTQQYPQLTTALVVCRESLHKHNVESLPHVVTLVDEYLNPFSSRKKVGRACRLGLPRRALEYAAARDPDWDNGQYMAAAAWLSEIVWKEPEAKRVFKMLPESRFKQATLK